MRLDSDLIGCALGAAVAASGLVGMLHGDFVFIDVLVAAVIVAGLVVWRRWHRFHERSDLRWAGIDALIFAGATIGLDLALRHLTGSDLLAGALSVVIVAALSAYRIAERWWRAPIGRIPHPAAGEVWWAQIPFQENTGSKDRPCLVLGGTHRHRTVLMFTSQDHTGRPGYLAAPTGMWTDQRHSFLKVDRLIRVRCERFRRRQSSHAPAALLAAAAQHYPRQAHFG